MLAGMGFLYHNMKLIIYPFPTEEGTEHSEHDTQTY